MKLDAKKGREVMVARKSAITTQTIAAKALGISVPTYGNLERHQDRFSITQLKTLHDCLGRDGKDTINAWIADKFGMEFEKLNEPAIR